MKGRPDPERIPHLKREAHRIRAKYDPDPDNAWFQHCYIRDMMVMDFGGEVADQDWDEGSVSLKT
jgi:hypothetical protein